MSIKILNEGFEKIFSSVKQNKELKEAYDPALKELSSVLLDLSKRIKNGKINCNLKSCADAFQNIIENMYPDKSWWEVTDVNIQNDLFDTQDPEKTALNIIKNIREKSDRKIESLKESGDSKEFKVRFYKIGGQDEGKLDHEEFFDTKEDAVKAFNKVFKKELFSLNPTVWKKQGKEWKRILNSEMKEAKQRKPKKAVKESLRRKRLSEDETIKRYSDHVPQEKRKYWYFTTHGVQPGSIPRDLNVLEIRDGQNDRGTWGTYVMLDGVLNTSELKKYDMRELVPPMHESKKRRIHERNLTRSKRHIRKINEAGEVVYPAPTGDDFEDAMNKKIARKNARDSWKEYEKSVEANREEKRKKASKIVSRKRTERNLQKAEDLVYELNRLGNKFIKVNVYLDDTGLYDILDTFTADSGYSNTSEITFYDDAAIDFYIPDNIVVNEDYGTIEAFEFGANGFEFSVFNEKGAWSNTFKDLEYVIASNNKIYSYIKEEIIPISEKYLHDIKEYLKRTKLESISKKSKKSIRESFAKKHAKKLKESHRRKLTESFDDMEVFMNTWANYNENGADSGITPTGWMSIDDAIEYCEEYADYEPFINDTDNIPFDDINEYSNASSVLQELKELQESGVDEDVLEAIIEATGYSVKEAIEIAERGDYYWYPGISSYTDLAYEVIDELGGIGEAVGKNVVNYIDEDKMRREYRWDIREIMRDTAEQEVDDAHEGEDEDSYDREQEIEDWMDEHEDEYLDMIIDEDIRMAEAGEVDLSNYFDYEAFGRDLSFDGYTITDKGIILVN